MRASGHLEAALTRRFSALDRRQTMLTNWLRENVRGRAIPGHSLNPSATMKGRGIYGPVAFAPQHGDLARQMAIVGISDACRAKGMTMQMIPDSSMRLPRRMIWKSPPLCSLRSQSIKPWNGSSINRAGLIFRPPSNLRSRRRDSWPVDMSFEAKKFPTQQDCPRRRSAVPREIARRTGALDGVIRARSG